jgi:hypothetical protein
MGSSDRIGGQTRFQMFAFDLWPLGEVEVYDFCFEISREGHQCSLCSGLGAGCIECEGRGFVYHGPHFLYLFLWMGFPRTGCSAGAIVPVNKEREVPLVIQYLREAAGRNRARFSLLSDNDSMGKFETLVNRYLRLTNPI